MAANYAGVQSAQRQRDRDSGRMAAGLRRNVGWRRQYLRMPNPAPAPPESDGDDDLPGACQASAPSRDRVPTVTFRPSIESVGSTDVETKLQESDRHGEEAGAPASCSNSCAICRQPLPWQEEEPGDEELEPEVRLLRKLCNGAENERLRPEEVNETLYVLSQIDRLHHLFTGQQDSRTQEVVKEFGKFTPLQTACRTTFREKSLVIDLLLLRADPNAPTGNKPGTPPPLDTAIETGSYYFIRPLLRAKADLMRQFTFEFDSKCGSYSTTMSHLHKMKNAVSIAAVAAYLDEDKEYLSRMPRKMLRLFLETPGKAPATIMKALFKEVTIYESSKDNPGQKGDCIETAKVPFASISTALGPPEKRVHQLTKEHFKEFLETLAPQRTEKKSGLLGLLSKNTPAHPIDVYQCTVPNLHKDMKFLKAIAFAPVCKGSELYSITQTECYAKIMWRTVKFWCYVDIFTQASIVFLLLPLTLALNSTPWFEKHMHAVATPRIWAFLILFPWVWNLGDELCQLVGFSVLGEAARYWCSPTNWLELLTLLGGTCCLVIMVGYGGDRFLEDAKFENQVRIMIVPMVGRSWMSMLYSMRLLEMFGMKSLPIFGAAKNIIWFCIIASSYFFSFVHMYYVLDVWSFSQSFLVLYRLFFLGDFDLWEMQDVDPHYSQESSNVEQLLLEEVDPEAGEYGKYVQILFIGVSLFGTVLLLNILIAVLCKEYDTQEGIAGSEFRRSRLQVVFDKTATFRGFRALRTMTFSQDDDMIPIPRSIAGEHGMMTRNETETTVHPGMGADADDQPMVRPGPSSCSAGSVDAPIHSDPRIDGQNTSKSRGFFSCKVPDCAPENQCKNCRDEEHLYLSRECKYLWFARAKHLDQREDRDDERFERERPRAALSRCGSDGSVGGGGGGGAGKARE